MIRSVSLLLFLFIVLFALTCQAIEKVDGPQSPINPQAVQAKKYPRIVLYSVSWCPHCKEAKEYLTSHNIPFINKDVELDDNAMKELTENYKSTGVPVIVLGNGEKVIKGFNREYFEKVLKEMSK
ncbi:MAG TPA: glutaredoxin domain-containing protein [Geobacteraceae bacterium]|nr:glutaredoxin domain-containing protein [Geobacteraceae bacterium]